MTALTEHQAPAPADTLRAEVRAILRGPAGRRAMRAMWAARERTGETDPRPVYRLLGRYGLLAPGWPAAYGGRALPASDAAAVVETMIAEGVSDTLHTLSVQICGTFLLSAGAVAQRAELLPALATGRRFCTVLYTEPAVGSDLAALTTRAVPTPDGGWSLSGRKVYSVRTRLADLALVAARTARDGNRYQGITLFLVALDAPGVTVRTLPSVAAEAFGDVTLDGVVVGPEAVVGQVDGAWPLITGALALERTGVDHVAKADAWLRAWYADARTSGALDDPAVLTEAGRLRSRVRAARALSRSCVEALDTGRVDPVDAAATKLWASETARQVATWCAAELHERALWTWRDDDPVAAGRLEAAYREAPGLTISAGTSEMMLELVAGAGLPGTDITPTGEDPAVRELRGAVRAVCGSYPADDAAGDADEQCWAELAALGVPGLRAVLGMAPVLAACEEAGAAGYDGGLLDTLTAIDAGMPATGRSCMVPTGRPGRPVGPSDGDLLVVTGSALPEPGARLVRLPRAHPGVAVRHRRTASGPVDTITLPADAMASGTPLRAGPEAVAVLSADLLRRAAWHAGLGMACLVAAVRRTRDRQQFGRALVDNQVVAFSLAELATRARAVRAALARLAAELDGPPDDSGEVPAGAAGALADAVEFARAAAARAVQLHGAFGLVADSPVAGLYRLLPLAVARGPAIPALYRLAASGGSEAGDD